MHASVCSFLPTLANYAKLTGFLRYMRATKWASSQAAIKRLEETLLWRREFGLYDERFTPEHVEPEVRLDISNIACSVVDLSRPRR